MKRILAFCLASAMAVSLVACAKPEDDNKNNEGDTSVGQTEELSQPVEQTEFFPGTVTILNGGNGFNLKGLRFESGRTGGEDINSWSYSLSRVRSVFELNEFIAYSIEYEYGSEPGKFGVGIFSHREISEYKDVEKMDGKVFFSEFELPYDTYPEALEDSFELPSDYADSGDYDMVFTYNGELVGGIVLRIFNEGELENKTDAELENMMAVG